MLSFLGFFFFGGGDGFWTMFLSIFLNHYFGNIFYPFLVLDIVQYRLIDFRLACFWVL